MDVLFSKLMLRLWRPRQTRQLVLQGCVRRRQV